MKKRLAALAALLLVISGLAAGCGNNSKLPDLPLPEPTDELVVYLAPYHRQWVRDAVWKFQKDYGMRVTVQDFQVEIDYSEPYAVWNMRYQERQQSYREMLFTALQAGTGPDVYFPIEMGTLGAREMKEGRFLDVTAFLEQDGAFESELLKGVLEAGQYEGKQYLIPLAVEVPVLVSSTSWLKEVGLRRVESDVNGFMEQIAGAIPQARQSGAYDQMMSSKGCFSYFLCCANLPKGQDGCYEMEALREFAQSYQACFADDLNRDESLTMQSSNTEYHDLLSGSCFFELSAGMGTIFRSASVLKSNDGYTLTRLRDARGDTAVSYAETAAVRANSPNQRNAWRFIKILISEEIQSEITSGIPVNKKAVGQEAKRYQREYNPFRLITAQGKTYIAAQLSNWEAGKIERTLTNVQHSVLIDEEELQIIWKTLLPYFKEQQSFESCYETIKIQLAEYHTALGT